MDLFTLSSEVNDKGFYNANKVFTSRKLAEKYLRKVVARAFWYYRSQGMKAEYLLVSSDSILIGFRDEDFYWLRYDYRVKKLVMLESEEDFSKYPIQF